ncbi:AMP-binding protein [Planctomycetales bacterium]|nr:AMP-binding protein [Planctomycetales bacterium]GHS98901.1 AMP-binding protein [Planctomycetales bacterium]GHT07425.1 AMP-binding protein [Planctomycetales bacterium]GHV18582.1 AMP-binding protein [Planctomycetales bacterium]
MSLQFTAVTIGQFFDRLVQQQPEKEFIVYPDRALRWTYRQFDERVNNVAKGLLSLGIKRGDHVGIWARNVPDWLTFMFATAKIGAVLVTVNTAYKLHEVAYVLEQSDMVALGLIDSFRDVNYIDVMYELVPELRRGQREEIRSPQFPFLKHLIYLGPEKQRGMFNINELILLGKTYPDDELRRLVAAGNVDDVINMQYTSGTTGFPKGVMLTSRNILNNGFYIGECQKFTGAERVCLPVPLFHCFGSVLGIMAILTHGATAVMVEVFDALKVLAAIAKEKCTAVYGVPTMFIAELQHPRFKEFDLSSLRTGIMSGSPCPMETMKQVIREMHMPEITIPYGLTEASPVMTQTRVEDPLELRVETVGRALPEIEVQIMEPETGEFCPPDTVGEIVCRGYNSMKGYYKMPAETAKCIDANGWLHSGDLGTMDANGYVRITGRLKDMIIRGGENIYPREIEEFLYTMPAVRDVQVIGVPDAKYGEAVGAFIIPHAGRELTPESVREFCLDKIARYKIPKHVFVVEAFPLTASGKIQKYKLRELAKERLAVTATVWDSEKKS